MKLLGRSRYVSLNVKENVVMSTTEKADQQFVRLPRELYYKLVEIAEREDRSVAGTVRNIVREAIARRTEQGTRGAAR
jgi:hypothetical protein